MTLRGNRLIPYSEITKTAFVEYDLTLAIALLDLNLSTVFDDEDTYRSERAFSITFKDKSEIRFTADTQEIKLDWLTTLGLLINREGKNVGKGKVAPLWAVALVKAQTAKKERK